MSQQTVLITGATGGIGYELAKLFARDKYRLILVSRKEEELEKTASEFKDQYGSKVITIAQDLSEHDSARVVFDKLMRSKVDVDVLVNNAGFGRHGDFADVSWKEHEKLLQINIITLTQLTRLFLPGMIARRQGRILNLSSTAAFQPGPHMAVFFAAKRYVLSFSEGLREELQGTGVTVTTLCPGPTRTNFEKRAKLNKAKLFKVVKLLTPERVAIAGYNGLNKGKAIVIPGKRNTFFAYAAHLTPGPLAAKASRNLLE